MPIFEYYCPDNHTVYRFFARRTGMDKKVPRCPADPRFKLEKRMSAFAIVGRTPKAKRDRPDGDDGAGGDDPRMERAMMELERDMSGMDEANPDPRQLGRLMRRMADLTGEKSDARMEEMIRRLEGGEDPDKLDEAFGDGMDGSGEEEGDEAGPRAAGEATGDGPESGGDLPLLARKMMTRLRGRIRPRAAPRVDPELYEMDAFLKHARPGRRKPE